MHIVSQITKWGLLLSAVIICSAITAFSQAPTVNNCPDPAGCIVLTTAEMKFYLARDTKATEQEKQIDVLKKAIDDTKQVNNDLRVELAKTTGMLTGAQQSGVDARAVITVLSANCKARNRIGLINF